MLAEAIVTAVVITTIMISLYSTFNRLYNSYNRNSKYYSIDGIYATKETVNYLLGNELNSYLNNVESEPYFLTIDYSRCGNNNTNNNAICRIKDTYNVNKMIIAKYNSQALSNLNDINQTFKEYRDFVINYYGISNNSDYSYIILTEIKNGDNDYYYASLRIE